ncbi:MAG: ribosome biogenesis GTP-binding protein YihA/YsxC [Desulfohalobiaceae bacterium]|nr:ribosome biogenesis GTP-binding protein YihA/YsxC [Desulfohalobiaceae bacterium]
MTDHFTLIKTVYEPDQLSTDPEMQVALAGRSNVGKSSLINRLAGRKKLAKISSTPGKTRSINYYWVSPLQGYLVDLPGYGYAKCSKKEREKWSRLVEKFFQLNKNRTTGVIVLLDSRLPPQKLDLELTSFLTSQSIPVIPVLTKADKAKMAQRGKSLQAWRDLLPSAVPPILCSSRTGLGSNEIWNTLRQLFLDVQS